MITNYAENNFFPPIQPRLNQPSVYYFVRIDKGLVSEETVLLRQLGVETNVLAHQQSR